MDGQESVDDVPVFFSIDGTGGVHKASSGFDGGGRLLQNEELDVGKTGYFLGCESPTDIDSSLDDPGIGTGDIKKDSVEVTLPAGRTGLCPVGLGGFHEIGTLASKVIEEDRQAVRMHVGGCEKGLSVSGGNDSCGFAAGGCAGVQDTFPGFGIQKLYGIARGRVGDIESSGTDVVQGQRTVDGIPAGNVVKRDEGTGIVRQFDQGVAADIERGRLVIKFQHSNRISLSEGLNPAGDEPFGGRKTDVEGEGVPFGQEFFFATEGVAENGVDETARFFGSDIDSFEDGCVFGEAHEKDLTKADFQDDARLLIESALSEIPQNIVEPCFVAQNAEDDGLHEVAVACSQSGFVGRLIDDCLRKGITCFPFLEALQGDLTGCRVLFHWREGITGTGNVQSRIRSR